MLEPVNMRRKEVKEAKLTSPTPYDDVFRTLIVECSSLVIPLINEMFHDHYHGDEEIQLASNEHYINQKGGGEDRRVTDSNVLIIGKEKRRYHLECESTPDDSSILIRIFEYDAQIALDQGSDLFPDRLIVSFPNSAILFLRSTSSTRDDMQIVMRTPGGEVSYTIPVMKVKDYSLEEIFDRKLYFLIPFYIFTYENRFDRIERNQDMLDSLQQEYRGITDRLDQLAQDGVINTFYKVSIVDMTNRVLQNIAAKYENIRKGMGAIMGGQVLDYEARRLKYQFLEEGRLEGRLEGIEEGRQEGRLEGRFEGRIQERIDIYRNEDHLSDEEIIRRIMSKFNLSEEAAKDYVLAPALI